MNPNCHNMHKSLIWLAHLSLKDNDTAIDALVEQYQPFELTIHDVFNHNLVNNRELYWLNKMKNLNNISCI